MGLSAFINKQVAKNYLGRPELAEFLNFQYPALTLQSAAFINELCYRLSLTLAPFVKSAAFELTNHCNLRCSICPNSRPQTREKGYMDLELFKKIISENPGLNLVQLNGWGEPFMHPAILECIKFAKSKGKRVYLYSNGTMIEGELATEILKSGLDRIIISIDGVDQAYERVRNFSYPEIENRVVSLINKRNELGSPLIIDVSMVGSKESEKDIDAFKMRWKIKADRIQILSYIEHSQKERTQKCRELWRGNPQVLWDGSVTVCCVDWSGELVFAKVGPDGYSLPKIYNCEKVKALRRMHTRKKFSGLCGQCNEYSSEYIVNRFGK
ncbi:MAG: radical SAM protein [Candidatus Omnitrophica bacterium]|nr:radical SAM protein [Candidatus Omnitrophota bacterium]